MLKYPITMDIFALDKVDFLGDLAVHAPRHARHYLEQEIEKEYGALSR